MKKKILAIAMFVALGLSANTQSDGFFTSNYNQNRTGEGETWADAAGLPLSHGLEDSQSAPVGSGLLVLAGLGVAYAMRKKN